MNDSLDLIRSALADMAWPAVPDDAGARALAMQFQFDQTQWWSPAMLEQRQMRQLQLVLHHAHAAFPFWRERLNRAGLVPDREITPEWFRSLPRIARSDIQAQSDALLNRNIPREHGATHEGHTSGSSGMPIRFMSTDLSQFFWRCITLREHLWHRRDLGGKLASIRLGLEESEAQGWGEATDVAFVTGSVAALSITRDVDYQLRWLQQQNPDYLLSFPSNINELARQSVVRGIALPRLREVRAVGETLLPGTRDLVRAAWGVPVTDIYSASEVGYIAIQCPECDCYHVQSEGIFVEILNARGSPCIPGEIGHVVVTPLHNFAMPLIRYEIGDLAEAGGSCGCGRGLPVIRKICGRVRNMLTLPDGRKNWPSLGDMRKAGADKIVQYQCIQRGVELIDVHLVLRNPLTPREEDDLRATMLNSLGHPFELRFVVCDRIDRSRSGKFEEFRSDL